MGKTNFVVVYDVLGKIYTEAFRRHSEAEIFKVYLKHTIKSKIKIQLQDGHTPVTFDEAKERFNEIESKLVIASTEVTYQISENIYVHVYFADEKESEKFKAFLEEQGVEYNSCDLEMLYLEERNKHKIRNFEEAKKIYEENKKI